MKSIVTLWFILPLSIISVYSQPFQEAAINPYGLITEGARSSPALIDIDNDEDLDLFTGYQNGNFGFYENIGDPGLPNFGVLQINFFGLTSLADNTTPFPVDLDNDGDYDMFAGSSSGVRYFENTGNTNVASYDLQPVNPFGIISPTGISKPALVDIDSDNDMDLFIGASDGNTYYYENTGTANNPSFAAQFENPFGITDIGERAAPAFVDIDEDLDMDLFIGSQSPGEFFFFENIGTVNAPSFDTAVINPFNLDNVGQDAKPFFADLDNDTDSDLISGNALGEFYYFQNLFTILGSTSVETKLATIYPNPFVESVTIKLHRSLEESSKLTIRSIDGRLIRSVDFPIGSDELVIDRGAIANGIYFIFLEDSDSRFLGKVVAH